jgi:hypothetical protein
MTSRQRHDHRRRRPVQQRVLEHRRRRRRHALHQRHRRHQEPGLQGCRRSAEGQGHPAEAFTLNAYAAVEVLKAGIEKAGSAEDAEAVAAKR